MKWIAGGSIARYLAGIAIILAVTMSSQAIAQDGSAANSDEWQFSGGIYLWGADIGGTTITGSEVEVGFDQLVDNLEMAFMGAFEARKNKWSVITDVIYLDIGANKTVDLSIPIDGTHVPVTTTVELDMEGWVWHLAAGYNLYEEGKSRLDFVGGVRYLDLSTDLFLGLQSLGPGLSRTIFESTSAWDGIIGLKGHAALGERWFLPYYIDVGAGQSKSTWQASAGIGFKAGRVVDLALTYRHLEWDIDSARVIDDINFSGPIFGVIFRW